MPPIHLSATELASLQTFGSAYDRTRTAALQLVAANATLADQESRHDTSTLAAALCGMKGEAALVTKARAAIDAAVAYQFPSSCRTLSVARNVCSYLCAAAVLDYRGNHVIAWARSIVDRSFPSGARMGLDTLRKSAGSDPSNWGAHARASFAAAAAYLDDGPMLDYIEEALASFLSGEFDPHWKFGDDLSWHPNPEQPTCLNRMGATIQGRSVDGVIPDDQRRAGSFSWPPPRTNYAWEGLQGTLTATLILYHAGRDLTHIGSMGLLRAYEWLQNVADHPASGDDLWQPWVVGYLYPGIPVPLNATSGPGKCMAWTDWTHATRIPDAPADPCADLRGELAQAQGELSLVRSELRAANERSERQKELARQILVT